VARIRTIKPEFFTSADIVALTPLARLFYVSLWCEADREGRLNWNTKTFKIRYFPADDCDIDTLAGELISAGLVETYEADGRKYAEIPCFKNHQVINNRESESVIPARVKVASARVQGEGRKEGKGREVASMRETSIPENFSISENVKVWADKNGHDQLEAHLAKFIDTAKARGYKYIDWDAAFRNAIAGNWAKVTKQSYVLPEFMRGAL
jgi:hypothetical protein